MSKEKRPPKPLRNFFRFIVFLLFAGGICGAGAGWYFFFSPNTSLKSEGKVVLIQEGDTFDSVMEQLKEKEIILNESTFLLTSKILKYDQLVKKGRYEVKNGMNNWAFVRKLRSGAQDPIPMRFAVHHTTEAIAKDIAGQLELSESELIAKLKDANYLSQFGFSPETIGSMFIPNTYFLYWNISADALFDRMHKEYKSFWNESRKKKAKDISLSEREVSVLASIVQAETYLDDEKARVAGVYMNRLKKGWRLQADPTVIFATGDFSIRRVLKKHLEIDSPYNTYQNTGLPPGPINNPDVASLEAVLNYEKHNYMYFCAKSDFSGYHAFSTTLSQHNRYAREYQKKLNERNIR